MYLDRNYGSNVMAWDAAEEKLYLVATEKGTRSVRLSRSDMSLLKWANWTVSPAGEIAPNAERGVGPNKEDQGTTAG